ncbi:MAG: hypothetical protein NXI04_25260 [Planctomycetaceae bacterium]|nr:hypothetical protein [Planctomycetaceae bacterium]
MDIPALSVGRLHLVGDDDRDEFINRAPVNTIMFGGAGNDLLIGGPLRDRLNGNEGKDFLRGGAGGDVLDPGSDLIEGEAILGGDAGDRLVRTRFVGLYINTVATSFDQVFQEDLDGRVGTDATQLNTQFRSVYLQMPVFTELLSQLRSH